MLQRIVRILIGARKADGGGGASVSADFGLLTQGTPRSVSSSNCPPHIAGYLSTLREEERTAVLGVGLPRPRPGAGFPHPRPDGCRGVVNLVRSILLSASEGYSSYRRRRTLYAGMGSGLIFRARGLSQS